MLSKMYLRFSPRNGEVILKVGDLMSAFSKLRFQSPQWGSNSKAKAIPSGQYLKSFQSPQWGSNSKGYPLESA